MTIVNIERWKIKTRQLPRGVVPVGYKVNQENKCELLPDEDIVAFLKRLSIT